MKDFQNSIKDTILKYFPKSFVSVEYSERMGKVIRIAFAVGQKTDWSNQIFENDPMATKILIFDVDKDIMTFDSAMGFNVTIKPEDKYHAYSSVKLKRTKKRGNKEQILKHIDRTFNRYLDLVRNNYVNLSDEHKWVKQYV